MRRSNAGQWKGALMETVKDQRTEKTAEIRFDKKRGMFYCIIGEDNTSASDIHSVRRWAKDRIKKSDAITWMPVLEVTAPDEEAKAERYGRRNRDDMGSKIETDMEFSAERYYIGKTEAGRWYTTSWASRDPESQHHLEDDEVIAHASEFSTAQSYEDPNSYHNRNRASSTRMPKFKLPFREQHSNTHYLPYDEEAWAGLQVIAENVAASRVTLRKILTDKNVIASLQQIAAGTKPLLLGSGK